MNQRNKMKKESSSLLSSSLPLPSHSHTQSLSHSHLPHSSLASTISPSLSSSLSPTHHSTLSPSHPASHSIPLSHSSSVPQELENALFNAIEFAAKFRKGNEKKISQTEKEQQEKVSQLQSQVKKSKQLVIQHVIKSRRLEHQYKQVIQTGEAIKRHVQEIPNRKTIKNKRHQKFAFEDDDLILIDQVAGLLEGSSGAIQRSLRLFSDASLVKELESFPIEQLRSLNSLLFSKIAWIASGKHISLTEAFQLFELGSTYATIINHYLTECGKYEQFDLTRWKVLKRMLRARLRIIYLAESLSHFEAESGKGFSGSTPFTLAAQQANRSPETKSQTRTSSSRRRSHQPSSSAILSQSLSISSPPASALPYLQRELTLSQSKQVLHSKKIQSNLSLISQTVPIGSLISAAAYAKRVGVQKLLAVLWIKAKGYLRLSFNHLKENVRNYSFQTKASQIQKYFGTSYFYHLYQKIFLEKAARYFNDWKVKLENLRQLEEYAAVIEIQRVGRGAIGRFKVRNRHKIIASIKLQKLVRGWLSRTYAKVLIYQKQLRWAVSVVENMWRKQKWIRTMRHLFHLRRQVRATSLIQRVYRGYKGRKEFKKRHLLKRQNYGALKLQCLWRRYEACVLVDEYYRRWKEVEGAITIQALVRGKLGRNRAARMKVWKVNASVIQRGVRCRQARDRVYHQRRHLAAILLQKHWRGFRTRKRIQKLLLARKQARERAEYALNMIFKTVRGYVVRRKWRPQIKAFTDRRVAAMNKIKSRYKAVKQGNKDRRMIQHWKKCGQIISRALKRFHELCGDRAERLRLEHYSATIIQALFRGVKGREYARHIWELHQQKENMKMPIYYRLKKMYYCDQNAFNGWAAIRIQCLVRRVQAKAYVEGVRMEKAAMRIQESARKYLERQEAKRIVKERKNALYYRDRMAVRIQKIHRGGLGRREANTHRSADIVKWFLKETKMCGLPKRCFLNFRIRKKHIERMQRMVVKIQALGRGYICRQRVRRIYKKLVKAREKRIHEKRARAATRIQGMYRQWKARKIVNKKRAEHAERERKRKQMEELDARLDDLHSSHLNDLLAVRVQQGVRSKLARNAKDRQVQFKYEERTEKEKKKFNRSAIKIQALVRGVQSRRRYKEIEPQLKKALKARAFCVECEVNVATKRCRECKDQYCDRCFESIHRKGKRKGHGWTATRAGGGDQNNGNNSGNSGFDNPNLWQEYWDDNAQAKYWYHTLTGEATWICPF